MLCYFFIMAMEGSGRSTGDDPVSGSGRIEDDSQYRENIASDFTCNISKGQLMSMVLAFAIRHKISGLALKDLIQLINTIVPNSLPRSKYYIDKEFFSIGDKLKFHHFCGACEALIVEGDRCSSCQNSFNEKTSKQDGNYFLTLPLEYQIRDLFENHELDRYVVKTNKKDTNSFVINGQFYSQARIQNFVSQDKNITLTVSIDGAPAFNSSNTSFWPVFCTINELDQRSKSRFIMMHSLWFSSKKPSANIYLKPFVEEMTSLFEKGLEWNDSTGAVHTTRCLPLICVSDSVARPMLQNMKQFNGQHGCGYCLHEGLQVSKGNGNVRVYPTLTNIPSSRTHDSIVRAAEAAQCSGKPIQGIKGPSIFMLIPHFDMVKGFPPDYMHCVLLGVVRQFTELWFDSSSHTRPFYLGRNMTLIDKRLIALNTPNEIKRRPRSLSLRKFWKASEWRTFLLYYSPLILSDILTNKFFHHWLLLVNAMLILLDDKVIEQDLLTAKLCLNKFVVEVKTLYGVEQLSYNVHLLTHLSECVENWGPLCKTSAFIFEDANGRLLSMFHGTQSVNIQTFKWFLAQRKLASFARSHLVNASEAIFQTYNQLSSTTQPIQKAELVTGTTLLGTPANFILSSYQKVLVQNLKGVPIVNNKCLSYKRICSSGRLFTTEQYASQFKRDNSLVQLKNTKICSIEHILLCKLFCLCSESADECVCEAEVILLGKCHLLEKKQPKVIDGYTKLNLLKPFKKIAEETLTVAFMPQTIWKKCLLIPIEQEKFVVKLLPFETD